MTDRRWDLPWTSPTGLAPQRPEGEPGFGVLAAVHLAVWFGASSLAGVALSVGGRNGGSLLVVAALLLAAGGVVLVRRDPLSAWVADLLLALGVSELAGSAGVFANDAGASDATCVVIASAVALPVALALYAVHQRVWLQVATVASAATLLVAALERDDAVPGVVPGLFLLLLGGFLAMGCLSGVARPVGSGWVLSALLGAAGAQVLLREDALLGSTVALLVLGAVVWGVLQSRRTALLPVVLIASTVLLPQVLSPVLGGFHAFVLSLSLTGAAVALLAVDLERRSVQRVHVGGVMATCTTLVLFASFVGSFAPSRGGHLSVGNGLSLLLQAVALAGLFVAVAAARRRAATVITGLFLVPALPTALGALVGGSAVVTSLLGLPCLAGAVWVAILLDRRAPWPVTAPFQQEQSLTGPGREWTTVASYPQVFDAVVGVLGSAGLPLQLVDRAAGRVVAGDPVRPVLVVAVWASDPVRTQVRAVGQPWDVDRLEADVAARLNSVEAPH